MPSREALKSIFTLYFVGTSSLTFTLSASPLVPLFLAMALPQENLARYASVQLDKPEPPISQHPTPHSHSSSNDAVSTNETLDQHHITHPPSSVQCATIKQAVDNRDDATQKDRPKDYVALSRDGPPKQKHLAGEQTVKHASPSDVEKEKHVARKHTSRSHTTARPAHKGGIPQDCMYCYPYSELSGSGNLTC